MPITLSETLREHLKQPGQSRVALVRAMGYRNQTKGLRNLDAWLERKWPPVGDQPTRLARALGLEPEKIKALVHGDLALDQEEARLARLADPRYRLSMRIMAAVYCQEYLPGELPLNDALERAAELARERHKECCLNAPSGVCYWLSSAGLLQAISLGGEPYMQVGGHRFVFQCGS